MPNIIWAGPPLSSQQPYEVVDTGEWTVSETADLGDKTYTTQDFRTDPFTSNGTSYDGSYVVPTYMYFRIGEFDWGTARDPRPNRILEYQQWGKVDDNDISEQIASFGSSAAGPREYTYENPDETIPFYDEGGKLNTIQVVINMTEGFSTMIDVDFTIRYNRVIPK